MKLIFLLSFQLLVVAVLAAATNEEDTVSLISNLLAKIKKLESNAVVASSSRKTRQEDNPCSNNDNSCPTSVLNGVVTYVRWGNDTCPPTASTIYSGVVGGSHYTHAGAAVDPLCLPQDPQYLLYQSGYQGYAYLYGAEYQATGPFDQSQQRNVPCSVCEVNGRTSKLMIPSWYECPPGSTMDIS